MKKEISYNAFVDLGLPSGTLWATRNAPGYYTFDEARKTFGRYLPSKEDIEELFRECSCKWNIKKKGLDIIGPNGASIFLPNKGFLWPDGTAEEKGITGNYWTNTLKPDDKNQAYVQYIYFKGAYRMLKIGILNACSVRLCRKKSIFDNIRRAIAFSSEFIGRTTRVVFAILFFVGGILGLSLVNSIFVDALAGDNNDNVLERLDELEKNGSAQNEETIKKLISRIDELEKKLSK